MLSIPLHFVQSLSVSCDALCWEHTNSPATLADIGISETRKELAMQAIAQVWTTGICRLSVAQTPEVIKLRQQGEEQQTLEQARERVERAVKDLKNKIASENEEVRQTNR